VGLEEVRRNDLNVIGHLAWQRCGEIAIDLDGDDAAGEWRKSHGQRAAPGADFEEGVVGGRLDCANELVDPGLFQEMLTEALPHRRVPGLSRRRFLTPRLRLRRASRGANS